MIIIEKNINELKPYSNNPRINDDSVQYVVNSIKEFGFKVPLVIDNDNVIVTGHTRYLAAKELGFEFLPCVVANDLTKEQINLFRVVDNKASEYSNWDYQLLDKEIEELNNSGIDLEIYGFENDDNNLDFIDNVLSAGIAGDLISPDIDKIGISFNVEDSIIVNEVLSKLGKTYILEKVLNKIKEEDYA